MVGFDVSGFDRTGPENPAARIAHEPAGDLVPELRTAVTDHQLRVMYQPIVALDEGRIAAVEALVRWQHPRLGLIPASQFLDIAERTGLIVPIGDHVLATACSEVAARNAATSQQWRASVNVSPRQLEEPDFPDRVRQILADNDFDPGLLQLEIREATLADASFDAVSGIVRLRQEGVVFLLDNFGFGFSSLATVRRISLDALKIDRRLVSRVGSSREDTAIIRALTALAEALGIDCIAEGIETAHQASEVTRLGASHGQGHHFAYPAPLRYLAMGEPSGAVGSGAAATAAGSAAAAAAAAAGSGAAAGAAAAAGSAAFSASENSAARAASPRN